MFESEWDAGLDDAQLAAVSHFGGPLVIVAGAGTGKTRTLTARVAQLLAHGVDPARVLLLTFTRRAAADMLARAAILCGDRRVTGRLWGGTFHAVAHRLITLHCDALSLAPESAVLDQGDAAELMDLLRHDHGLAGTAERFPRADTLVDVYSRAVNTGRPAREVIAAEFPWCDRTPTRSSTCSAPMWPASGPPRCSTSTTCCSPGGRLLTDPTLGPMVAGRWDHVLVDEYQDVNQVQVDIVRRLRPAGTGLTVVGDDAQAIYGFRGADAGPPADLASTLPDVTIVRLERNFRSRQPLLDLANVVRPTTRAALQVRLYSDRRGRTQAPADPLLRRARRSPPGRRGDPGERRGRHAAAGPGRPDACRAPQRPAGDRTDRTSDPVRQVRRPEVPRSRARQGLPGRPAAPRQPRRRDRVVPAAAPARRHRPSASAQPA